MLLHMSKSFVRAGQIGGARRDRTADLLRARQALSQLSYGPFNLSFFRQPALHLPRAWSHTQHVCSRRTRQMRLAAGKNPALKTSRSRISKRSHFDAFPIISFSRSAQLTAFEIFSGRTKARRRVLVHSKPRASFGFVRDAARKWWVWVDLNHRPHPYQGCALTN